MSTDERGHFLRYWLAKGCNLVATHRREDDMTEPAPVTESGLRQYDHLPASDAVVAAWTIPGDSPGWHEEMRYQVRHCMPLLARALDRLAENDGSPG